MCAPLAKATLGGRALGNEDSNPLRAYSSYCNGLYSHAWYLPQPSMVREGESGAFYAGRNNKGLMVANWRFADIGRSNIQNTRNPGSMFRTYRALREALYVL